MIEDLRLVWALLPRRLQFRWLALVPLNVAAAIVEGTGAGLVFGFITVVAGDSAQTPQVISRWVPALGGGDDPSAALVVGGGLVVFYVVRACLLAATAYAVEAVNQRSTVTLADRLLHRYLTAPYAFHLSHNSSILIERLESSIPASITLVLSSAAHISAEILVGLALIAILALASPAATVVAVAITIVLLVVPTAVTKRFFLRWGARRMTLQEEWLTGVRQSLGAFREIRLAGREEYFHAWVTSRREALGRIARRQATLATWLRLGSETAFFSAMVAIVTAAAMQLGPGAHVISTVGLFAYATFRLVPSANRITMYRNSARAGHAFVRDLHRDLTSLSAAPFRPTVAGATPPTFADWIDIDGISFTYGGATRPALEDVTVQIPRGTSVGIVGPTGAGKSTLVGVLLGLLVPSSGRITVDGRDIHAADPGWHGMVGYVPQEVYLVDDTLRRNIAFGYADEDIDERRVMRSVRRAGVAEFLDQLPHGLDTAIGEQGVRLSGGQRQRVAIARALYQEPAILVFDEAMSALDFHTEREIVRAIEELRGDVTLVVITHRIDTVRGCDQIVVLRDGRVTAVGTYDALLQNHAPFQALTGRPPNA